MRRSDQVPDLDDPREGVEVDPIKQVVAAALFGDAVETPRVGRFEITGELGRGGMGEVLAAYDDELDRKVAIKLLHSEIGESQAVRLKREARALAKLSHPNVVQVYEVGTHEGRVFIAMEFVEGKTLRAWIREDAPSPTEVFRVFREAAIGLAAAHGAGLIHRDFKPDNVLLGTDGRPRILDFGLARADGSEDDVDIGQALAELEKSATDMAVFDDTIQATITRTGAILGTPAYMSPEQFTGRRVTASTDQFSFCVALWEALHGQRPFQGGSIAALNVAVSEGEFTEGEASQINSGVRRVIQRGLAADPGDRYPSMEQLIDALDAELERPSRSRRNVVLAAGLGAVLAAGAGGLAAVNRQTQDQSTQQAPQQLGPQAPEGFCAPLEQRLEGLWDDETRAAIAQRYESGPLRGQQWWKFESRFLDEWVADWSRIYEKSCEDEYVTDLPRFSLRQTCLDQRMVEIETRVRLLEDVDPGVRAELGVQNYAPFVIPKECENDALVSAVSLYPSDPQQRGEFLDVMLEYRRAYAETIAAFFAGTPEQYADSFARAEAATEAVEKTGFEPAMAELLALSGNGVVQSGIDTERGFAELEQAQQLARKTRSEQTYVLAGVWAYEQATYLGLEDRPSLRDDGLDRTFEAWEAGLESVGSPLYGTTELLVLWGRYRAMQGDSAGARDKAEQAIDVAIAGWGKDSLYTARVFADAAVIYVSAGLDDLARSTRADALAIHDRIFGPDCISTSFLLVAEFNHALALGDLDAAEKAARTMRRLARANFEPGTVRFRSAEAQLALVLMTQGKFKEGEAVLAALDEKGGTFVASVDDEWRILRLVHMAILGEPGAAARRAATAEKPFPAVEELATLLEPILAGTPAREAEATLRANLEDVRYSVPQAAARIALGRLQEELGQSRNARESYEAVEAMDLNTGDVMVANLGPLLKTVARFRLDQLDQ